MKLLTFVLALSCVIAYTTAQTNVEISPKIPSPTISASGPDVEAIRDSYSTYSGINDDPFNGDRYVIDRESDDYRRIDITPGFESQPDLPIDPLNRPTDNDDQQLSS